MNFRSEVESGCVGFEVTSFKRLFFELKEKDILVFSLLNEIIDKLQHVAEANDCQGIKWFNNKFLVSCGIKNSDDNIKKMANFFLSSRYTIQSISEDAKFPLLCRSGFCCGAFKGGGENNFAFDIFGNCVNLSARVLDCCEDEKINFRGDHLEEVLKKLEYIIEERGVCNAKGFGQINLLNLVGYPKDKKLFSTLLV